MQAFEKGAQGYQGSYIKRV